MFRQAALQGLRHSVRIKSTPRSKIVLDKKTDPLYQPMRPSLFFSDGSMALTGNEPQLICNDYRVKLRHPSGRVSWVRVSPDTYNCAVIGKAFTG